MARQFWRAETGIFIALWLVLMLFGRTMLLRDPGTFWHVVVGEQMLDARQVIDRDTLTFTSEGKPWVAQWWAAECGMAAVYRWSGWDGLLLVTVTLLAGVYTLVASRLIRSGLHLLPALLVVAMVLMASSHQFHVRPLILTIVLLGVCFSLLVDVEAGRERLWWLVPVVLLWANSHGGVLAGLGSLGLVTAAWCMLWLLGKDSPVRKPGDLVAMAALVMACCAAVLVNPYGLELPRAWWNTLSMPLPGLIQEHRRLDPTDPVGITTILLGVGYLFALVGVFPKRPRATWLLPLVWFVLTVQRVRHAPLFAITAAIAMADLLPHTRWAKWLQSRDWFRPPEEQEARSRCWPAAVLPLVLVVAAAILQAMKIPAPLVGSGWAGPDPARFPNELVSELARINDASPEGTPIFNDLSQGGFLIFYAPRLKVFIDDRCALHGTDFLRAYDRARRREPAQIDRWQQEYGFRYALVETGLPFDDYLRQSPDWKSKPAWQTPAATLYRYEPGD